MRSQTLAALVVALAVAGCGGTAAPSVAPQASPAGTVTAPAASVTVTAPPSPTPEPTLAASPSSVAGELEGTWTTGTTTCEQQDAVLARAGFTAEELQLGTWNAETCEFLGAPFKPTYILRFAGDDVLIFEDGQLGWRARMHDLAADSFQTTEDGSEETATFGYSVDGDRLSLELIRLDTPPGMSRADQLVDRIAGTVIFGTVPYTREARGSTTPFTSSLYPYSLTMPAGWTARPPSSDEDFLESPHQVLTAIIGTGRPEPGQSVQDRVNANRATQFADCRTDPSQDRPMTMGGEPGILWWFVCDTTYGLAANTIHDGLGYRLRVEGSAELEDDAATAIDALLADFAFTK